MTVPRNGNALSAKVLMILLAGLWTVLAGGAVALFSKAQAAADDAARAATSSQITQAAVEEVRRSVMRVEARLSAIDAAAIVAATEQRQATAQRIDQLENRQAPVRPPDPSP